MRALVVVQARMGGSRLPGKVREEIGGYSVLEHVVSRGLYAGFPVVVATPGEEDFEWARFFGGTKKAYLYQHGDEDDVLGRVYHAAKLYTPTPDVVVRLTADCPFVPADGIREVAKRVASGQFDYAETRSDPSPKPNGIDAQAFTYDVLMRAAEEWPEREHVTDGVRAVAGRHIELDEVEGTDLSAVPPIRLTVDTAEDLDRYREMVRWLPSTAPGVGKPIFRDILRLYAAKPHLFYLDGA